MSQSVDKSSVHGINKTEALGNAASHGPKDRHTQPGITLTQALSNAVLNTQTATE